MPPFCRIESGYSTFPQLKRSYLGVLRHLLPGDTILPKARGLNSTVRLLKRLVKMFSQYLPKKEKSHQNQTE